MRNLCDVAALPSQAHTNYGTLAIDFDELTNLKHFLFILFNSMY